MNLSSKTSEGRPESLTDRAYRRVKQDIFDFKLFPGEFFTESAVAARVQASRTPVREALSRLEREGFVKVHFRSGWQVKPLDFEIFDELYDIRIALELSSLEKLHELGKTSAVQHLQRVWTIGPGELPVDGPLVCSLDERFHEQIVEATGNAEMAKIHHQITERIRLVRRLDFTRPDRIAATYEEHSTILGHIAGRQLAEARSLLRSHIEESKASVRRITFQMLQKARPSP